MSIGLAEEAVGSVPAGVKSELLGVGTSLLDAILGYLVVFIGLILLMAVAHRQCPESCAGRERRR